MDEGDVRGNVDLDGAPTSAGIGAHPTVATLVRSKLTVPPPQRQAIRRPKIEAMLAAGVQRKVTSVVAPAGFGKTTLVTGWAGATDADIGWVSLDSGDNDPARFWSYVEAALRGLGITIASLENPADRWVALSNALAGLDDDVVLVLDDYHLITAPEIHRDLAAVVEQQLPHFHLVLVTRSDPPIVRARWKANGDAVEIRARHLAFDDDEMALFLDDRGIDLDPPVLTSLSERVGGWPAALGLVALWVTDHHDKSAAVEEFAASDATIADYLVSEVLAALPKDLRRFLLLTSVLPRLCAGLCDALTGNADGAALLADIERRDLFVQAMDGDHEWLRYHPLFQELLRNELRRSEPHRVREMHARAARWFAAHGFVEDAVTHGIRAEDWAAVRRMILTETLAIGSRYPPTLIERWLDMLPIQVLHDSPFFLLLQGYVRATLGNLIEAKGILERSEKLAATQTPDPDLPELSALVHAIGCGIARLECDLDAVRRLVREADAALTELGETPLQLGPMVRAIGDTALAGALFWHGDLEATARILEHTEMETASRSLERMRVNAMGSRALLLAVTGRLREAAELAPRVIEEAGPIGVSTSFQTNPARLASAVVTMYRGNFDDALKHLALVREWSRVHGDRGPRFAAVLLTARIVSATGDRAAALDMIDGARAEWMGWTAPAAMEATLAAEEARLVLSLGDTGAASVILERLGRLPQDVASVSIAMSTTRARLLLAGGDSSAAAVVFGSAAEAARSSGCLPTAVDLLVAAAVAARSAVDDRAALGHLERALRLAADETIMAPFVWEASTVRPLLLAMESGLGDHAHVGFRHRLLLRLGTPIRLSAEDVVRSQDVASLSERELTVLLRMLGSTLSNADIAEALRISPNTLKTHVRNIHRKLGVDNRRDVLARAQELELR